MDNIKDNTPITIESVLAAVKEMLAISSAKFDRQLEKSAAEFDRKMAESKVEFDRKMAESKAEFDHKIAESRAETDRRIDRRIAEIKAEAKAEEERRKAEAKAEEERRKAEAKAEEERRKAEEERRKAEAKVEEERRKAEAKAEEERRKAKAKAEEKRRKAEAKAEEKRRKVEEERRKAEEARRNAEADRRRAEFERYLKESGEKFDKEMNELKISMADTDRKIKSLSEQVAGITKSNGDIAENYFFNSFEKGGHNFFGQKFDKIIKGKGQIVDDEYDAVLINGHSAGIIEVKYKARKDDIKQVLKKVNTFRINFPEHKNHKVYLALAAYSFNENLERECLRQGIAVIKQVGDVVIILDNQVKAF